jgi:hypothetical protein
MHEPYEKKLGRIHDFKVKYRLYKPDEGGRKTGVTYQGIRYDFAYEDYGTKDFNLYMIWPEFENENGVVITEDFEIVREIGTARMWIVTDDMRTVHRDKIKIGTKGFMMEASRRMGECEVIEIDGLITNRTGK